MLVPQFVAPIRCSTPARGGRHRRKAGSRARQLRNIISYAVLAPSAHNSQPWLFRVSDNRIELYCDRERALPVVDPDDRELVISCGAALFFLRVALGHFGFDHRVETLPDPTLPELLAAVTITGRRAETMQENALFHAIARRHTYRRPFRDRPVRESMLSSLRHCARREGAWLHVLRGSVARSAAAELVAEADRIQMNDGRFREELTEWIRPQQARDGLSPRALGMPKWFSPVLPLMRLVMRTFNLGCMQARKDRDLAMSSPVLAVLATGGDERSDWLSAGQALARVLLRAASAGISASFLNQPIEVMSLRGTLRELSAARGYPQLFLRMGYGRHTAPSQRRPVADVVLHRPARSTLLDPARN